MDEWIDVWIRRWCVCAAKQGRERARREGEKIWKRKERRLPFGRQNQPMALTAVRREDGEGVVRRALLPHRVEHHVHLSGRKDRPVPPVHRVVVDHLRRAQ